MMPDNNFYGHTEILRHYCGAGIHWRIPARLQHGWTRGPGLAEQYMAAPYPKLIWSRRNLNRARELGFRGVLPIGAPFLYLPPLDAPVAPTHPKRLLAFPFHGTDAEAIRGDMERYAAALDELRRDGFGPITVCMYYLEYEQPRMRAPFERLGFEVTTAGRRDGNPLFLHRIRDLILSHAVVTANRVSTATFYALALGRAFITHGPAEELVTEALNRGQAFVDWQGREFPQLQYRAFQGDVHRELGEAELGLEFKLEPEVLSHLLSWSPAGLPVHALRLGQHLGHVAWRRLRGIPPPLAGG